MRYSIVLWLVSILPAVTQATTPTSGCRGQVVSRWSADKSVYIATHHYGLRDDEYLQAANGLASTSHNVLIFDALGADVHVLTHDLKLVQRFGRTGKGPGELSAMPILEPTMYSFHNYLAASDKIVYVFDWTGVTLFTPRGEYVNKLRNIRGRTFTFTIRAIHASPQGLVYGFDSLDWTNARRRLQTWLVDKANPSLIHELPLPLPPNNGRSFHSDFRQAKPLWAAMQNCVVVGDGDSRRLLKIDLVTREVDTLRLPRHDVPTETDNEAITEMRKRGLIKAPNSKPTSLMRWAEVAIDPDGHVWVNPWLPGREPSKRKVYRIDPVGKVHEEHLAGFPSAFGAPGVFYARETDPETDQRIVVRYAKR